MFSITFKKNLRTSLENVDSVFGTPIYSSIFIFNTSSVLLLQKDNCIELLIKSFTTYFYPDTAYNVKDVL